jgi:tRNA threonylcarbamoyladenosine biosynthesis protein TsaE
LKNFTLNLADEAATLACGARFANALQAGLAVYLHGDLGAGKTTYTRGVLQGLGYVGKVKSPTYTLVEPYQINIDKVFNYTLYHFDLYRFTSDEEWEEAGFREYFNPQSICMIEWPEKAQKVLPQADIEINLSLYNSGRDITFSAKSALGNKCLEKF